MEYLPLFIFILTATATPGPNNLMIMTSGLNFGVKASVPHLLGICTGFPLMVIGIGLGVSVLFQQFPWLHRLIQILSILYLFYMAWRIASTDHLSNQKSTAKPFSYIQALLFQWVNPKAWIMATTAISIYSDPEQQLLHSFIIAIIFMLVAFPSVAIWLLFGHHLKKLFSHDIYFRIFNILMAFLLIWAIFPAIIELYNAFA